MVLITIIFLFVTIYQRTAIQNTANIVNTPFFFLNSMATNTSGTSKNPRLLTNPAPANATIT